MAAHRTVYVKCRFARGGFAHERVFWIAAPDGGEYRGLAYIAYCWHADGRQVATGEPPPGETMEGLVTARVISESLPVTVTVQVPDGELCDIDPSLTLELGHVPVGP